MKLWAVVVRRGVWGKIWYDVEGETRADALEMIRAARECDIRGWICLRRKPRLDCVLLRRGVDA